MYYISQNKDVEDELAVFRQQWQRELESTPSPYKEIQSPARKEPKISEPQLTDEEKV